MHFSVLTVVALQALGTIAAPVAADYADLAKDSIVIKSAGTYKRGEEKREADYEQLAKDSIVIKSAGTYKRGEEYADLAKDSIVIKSAGTYKRGEEVSCLLRP